MLEPSPSAFTNAGTEDGRLTMKLSKRGSIGKIYTRGITECNTLRPEIQSLTSLACVMLSLASRHRRCESRTGSMTGRGQSVINELDLTAENRLFVPGF
jgi:hypothetical protein